MRLTQRLFSFNYYIGARSSVIIVKDKLDKLDEIVVTHEAEKNWTYDRSTDRTRCYFQYARLTAIGALS